MMTSATAARDGIHTLEVVKQEEIAAAIEIVFETVLKQMGPLNQHPDGSALSMTLEAWPGGRWYRDFGNSEGQLWGHVQAIKRPSLVEICGPLFIPNAVISNVQYRLTEVNGATRLEFAHRAIGQIPARLRERVGGGWAGHLARIRKAAENRSVDAGKRL